MQDDLIERLQSCAEDYWGELAIEAADRIAALEADNARLTGLVKEAGEALEPYAKQADKYDPEEEDGLDEAWSGGFLLMDLRRARATLAKIKDATDA